MSFGNCCAWDPDQQKYADPRIRIQGVKYQQKLRKNFFTPLTQI